MPRTARNRNKKLPHHIISRSISEVQLFNCDKDKEFYINLIESSSTIFRIEIISYCLMDNHVHILIHPRGGDISKFMHAINNTYAKYYNRKNKRRGHLFSERFKNIVVEDTNQLLRNSTYIHNNASDLLYKGYSSIEDYPYSSIKDYTQPGLGRGLAKPNFVFSIIGGGWQNAIIQYKNLLEIQSRGREVFEKSLFAEFDNNNYSPDKTYINTYVKIDDVILIVASVLKVENSRIRHIKYIREHADYKKVLAICLRIYCDLSLSAMTKVFNNHSSSTIGKLVCEGYKLITRNQTLYNQIDHHMLAQA